MIMRIKQLRLLKNKEALRNIPEGKCLIQTINAHSVVVAASDAAFEEALLGSDVLIPDGIGIVKACKWVKTPDAPSERVAGADLFAFEMEKLEKRGGKASVLGQRL